MKLTGIISAICMGIVLSSCSAFRQQEETAPPAAPEQTKEIEKADSDKADSGSAPTEPTSEAVDMPGTEVSTGTADIPLVAPTRVCAPMSSDIPASQAEQATIPEPPPIDDRAETETSAESTTDSGVIPGGLRMRRFAPPEEAVSSSDEAEPAPNSVELHGFRSPSLKGGKLPMNINGKINKAQ